MGVFVVCLGRTLADDDLGMVGLRLDTHEWVRPISRGERARSLSARASTPLPRAADSADLADVLDGGDVATALDDPFADVTPLDVLDLGDVDETPTVRGPECLRVDPARVRRAGRYDGRDAAVVVEHALAAGHHGSGLHAVRPEDPTFLVLRRDGATLLSLLWSDHSGIVEAEVLDPVVVARAAALPRGQHDPETFGFDADRLVLTVGRERRPGQLLRRPAVLGLIAA